MTMSTTDPENRQAGHTPLRPKIMTEKRPDPTTTTTMEVDPPHHPPRSRPLNLSIKSGGSMISSIVLSPFPPLPPTPADISDSVLHLSPGSDHASQASVSKSTLVPGLTYLLGDPLKPSQTKAWDGQTASTSPKDSLVPQTHRSVPFTAKTPAGITFTYSPLTASSNRSVPSTSSSGSFKAKGSRNKQGWANLPIGVMHNIFGHMLAEVALPDQLGHWLSDEAQILGLAMIQRAELCRLRLVCTGWRNAVDPHSFWPEYTLLLDPSKHHHSTLSDLEASSLTPSTPSFPTLFHRARHTTLSICIACRLNHPKRLGLYPANRRRLCFTRFFGSAPTCDKHHGSFCSSCLIEQETRPYQQRRNGQTVTVQIPTGIIRYLLRTERSDTDPQGRSRQGGIICERCRIDDMREAVEIIQPGLDDSDFNLDATQTDAANWYLDESKGDLRLVARLSLEELWLRKHTRWDELHLVAMELQYEEAKLRLEYLVHNRRHSLKDKTRWCLLVGELNGVDAGSDVEAVRAVDSTVRNMLQYSRWKAEAAGKTLTQDDIDKWTDNGYLEYKWWSMLYKSLVKDWITDRVRHGFWISPFEESVNLRTEEGVIDNIRRFADLAKSAQHPFASRLEDPYEPVDALEDRAGLMSALPARSDATETSVPSSIRPTLQLIRALEEEYAEQLRCVIRPALVQCVKLAVYRCGKDIAKAETMCEEWSVEALLSLMRRPAAWVKDGLLDEEPQRIARAGKVLDLALCLPKTHSKKTTDKPDLDHQVATELVQADPKFAGERITVEVDVNHIMIDHVEWESVTSAETTSCGRGIQSSGRESSPRIEIVLEDDDEETFDPVMMIQELSDSPSGIAPTPPPTLSIYDITSSGDSSPPRSSARTTSPASHMVDPVLRGQIKERDHHDQHEHDHSRMKSIDDVLEFQQRNLRRASEASNPRGREGPDSRSVSLGKRKEAPGGSGGEYGEARSGQCIAAASQGTQRDLKMVDSGTVVPSHYTTASAITAVIKGRHGAESPTAFRHDQTSANPTRRSPESITSTSTASTTSNPSSDVTSGPALMTPREDITESIQPIVRSQLPEHLRDASEEDLKAIAELTDGTFGSTFAPATKAPQPISSSPTVHHKSPLDRSSPLKNPKSSGRASSPAYCAPLNRIPYVPPLPAHALGDKTVEIIKRLWWEVRAELRVCRCSICLRSRAAARAGSDLELDDIDDLDEDVEFFDEREEAEFEAAWREAAEGGKRLRLG
ncbi:hypothetical protein BD324DRAFT_624587 [Kockovaella imperatae]|uniref:F-box domain-containing protein n=1 Tax=Kockovaella imperatae TaxID=4999 RepID=A0A1Y1UG59_9TREE|nr:hypothetical protein BD324DRAFT_624587 [Kockovaella imperatae]ORX37050.1 hypothetical protein BD324DRAFT_624587 [Kockovaella imperatae]